MWGDTATIIARDARTFDGLGNILTRRNGGRWAAPGLTQNATIGGLTKLVEQTAAGTSTARVKFGGSRRRALNAPNRNTAVERASYYG